MVQIWNTWVYKINIILQLVMTGETFLPHLQVFCLFPVLSQTNRLLWDIDKTPTSVPYTMSHLLAAHLLVM